MYYIMTRNGQMLGIMFVNPYNENYEGVSYHEMDGLIPDLNSHEWDSEMDTLKRVEGGTILTKLQFLDKFTMAERISITSSSDPVIVDIMRMFDIADYINMSDPKTVQAIQYFLYTNHITPERYAEIIA